MSIGKKLAAVGVVAAGLYALNRRRQARGSRTVTTVPSAVVSLIEDSKPRKATPRKKQAKRARRAQAKRTRTA